MKVIKEGKKINATMRVTCKKCEAELEIQAGDIKKIPGWGLFDRTTYYYECPCCLRKNVLDSTDLTKKIRSDLNK